jgi:hypothetical protein
MTDLKLTIGGKTVAVDAYGMSDEERDRIADRLADVQRYLDTNDERAPEMRIAERLGGEYYTDGGSYSVQALPVEGGITIWIDAADGIITRVEASRGSLRDHLLDWDLSDLGVPTATWLASWGIDVDGPPEVGGDYDGECAIWVRPHYYAGLRNVPRPDYLRNDDGERIVLGSRTEALAYLSIVDAVEGGHYYLSHGEYAPPAYKIVAAP